MTSDTARFDAFDAAAERVRAAYAAGDQRAADRAWTELYERHLRRDIAARTRVWQEMKAFGIAAEDAEQEIVLALFRKLKKGDVLNYAQLKRIYTNVLVDLKRRTIDRAPDEGAMIHAQLMDTTMPERDREEVRAQLTKIADEFERNPRLALRAMVLRLYIAGVENQAEMARELGVPEGSVRSATYYLWDHIREHHPELREYLDTWQPAAFAAQAAPTRAAGPREGE